MRYLYLITNKINGKRYVGQTKNYKHRMQIHRTKTKTGSIIHQAIKKHGDKNFLFEILAICEDHMIDEMELKAIKVFDTVSPNGYNIQGGGCSIKSHNNETKKKISIANKGQKRGPCPEERRNKISNSHKGKKIPQEQIEKMRATKKANFTEEERERLRKMAIGRVPWNKGGGCYTPEQTKRMSDASKGRRAWNKGVPMPEEQKEKIRVINKGKIPPNKGKPCSAEQKKKQSEIMKKKYIDNPEMKKRIAETHKGRKQSEETKKKRSESMKVTLAGRDPILTQQINEKRAEAVKKYYAEITQEEKAKKKSPSEGLKKYFQEHPEAREAQAKKRKAYYDSLTPEQKKEYYEKRFKKKI